MFKTHFMWFLPYLVFGGGKGLGHNLLMQFSTLGSSEIESSETDFFFIFRPFAMIKYICEACSRPSFCVFPPIWVLDGWVRRLQRGWGTTCLGNFPPSAAQKWTFFEPFFLIF